MPVCRTDEFRDFLKIGKQPKQLFKEFLKQLFLEILSIGKYLRALEREPRASKATPQWKQQCIFFSAGRALGLDQCVPKSCSSSLCSIMLSPKFTF